MKVYVTQSRLSFEIIRLLIEGLDAGETIGVFRPRRFLQRMFLKLRERRFFRIQKQERVVERGEIITMSTEA
jgi:hypothetical protein